MRALTHYFDPPKDDFVGEFGWLCGFSADAPFMEAALERFTGMTSAVRSREGLVAIVAMLDPGNSQISPIDVPGLWHAPYVDRGAKPFRLLHAKVALLGFRHDREDRFIVRLVVSTGNWTRETLESSIDLAWCMEIASEELARDAGESVRRRCADVKGAEALFAALRSWFDCGVVNQLAAIDSATSLRRERHDDWIRRITAFAKGEPRFFDNRRESLLAQLVPKATKLAGSTARNRLCMGSGFFELPGEAVKPASCLTRIVDTLRREGLLTSTAQVRVFANRLTSQGLAGFSAENWTIHEGRWVREPDRTLHAKFIFSGFEQGRSNSCGSAWLYLGSGNLTVPGFISKMNPSAGNIEAGVVLATPGLEWTSLGDHLPVSDKSALVIPPSTEGKCDLSDRLMQFVAAPVHAFRVQSDGESTHLMPMPVEAADSIELLDAFGVSCPREGVTFCWSGAVPRMLHIRWMLGSVVREGQVPCVDAFGRIAGSELPDLTVEEAWDELTNFPLVNDDDPDANAGDLAEVGAAGLPPRTSSEARYALRRIMELVERVAATQCGLPESEWTRWCLRLEQTLVRTARSETVAKARELGFNVLSPLAHSAFLPDFVAENTVHRKKYLASLKAVYTAWDMQTLPALESLA